MKGLEVIVIMIEEDTNWYYGGFFMKYLFIVISFLFLLNDKAKHVVKNMQGLEGSITYDIHMENADSMDNYYAGTCTIKQ